jgi:hypothetical protein
MALQTKQTNGTNIKKTGRGEEELLLLYSVRGFWIEDLYTK